MTRYDRNGGEVGEICERIFVLNDEIIDVALTVVRVDRHRTNPFGCERRRVFLIEALALDAVG